MSTVRCALLRDQPSQRRQVLEAIDQFVDSTDVLGYRRRLCRQIGRVYDLATGPANERKDIGPRPQQQG